MPCVDGFTTGSEIARSKLRSGTSAMRCHCDDWSLLRPSFSSVGEKTVESSDRFSEGGSGTRVGIARAPRAVCRRLPDGGKRHSRLEPFRASHDRQQAATFGHSTPTPTLSTTARYMIARRLVAPSPCALYGGLRPAAQGRVPPTTVTNKNRGINEKNQRRRLCHCSFRPVGLRASDTDCSKHGKHIPDTRRSAEDWRYRRHGGARHSQ
jgi:hypothetical protein